MIRVVPLIDFLAVPDGQDEDVESYVQRLLDFSSLSRIGVIKFLPAARTADALIQSGRYPFIDQVRRLLARSADAAFSAEDINRVLNGILATDAYLEDLSGISDLLWRDELFQPALACFTSPSLRDDAIKAVLSVALWAQTDQATAVVVGICESGPRELATQAAIDALDGPYKLPVEPYTLDHSVRVAGVFAVLVEHLDANKLFREASNISSLSLAIRVRCLQVMHQENPALTLDDIPTFDLRQSFLASADHYSFRNTENRADKLLKAVVDVVLDKNRAHGHALRTSAGGGAPPQKRGADIAWRHDIDDEFHLHLWRCRQGPELVTVVVHNDFTIEP